MSWFHHTRSNGVSIASISTDDAAIRRRPHPQPFSPREKGVTLERTSEHTAVCSGYCGAMGSCRPTMPQCTAEIVMRWEAIAQTYRSLPQGSRSYGAIIQTYRSLPQDLSLDEATGRACRRIPQGFTMRRKAIGRAYRSLPQVFAFETIPTVQACRRIPQGFVFMMGDGGIVRCWMVKAVRCHRHLSGRCGAGTWEV